MQQKTYKIIYITKITINKQVQIYQDNLIPALITDTRPESVANGVLKNATLLVPLTSNFLRSLEMPLINCKVEFKLRQPKYCVLSAGGNDNDNDQSKNIIFDIKDTQKIVGQLKNTDGTE